MDDDLDLRLQKLDAKIDLVLACVMGLQDSAVSKQIYDLLRRKTSIKHPVENPKQEVA